MTSSNSATESRPVSRGTSRRSFDGTTDTAAATRKPAAGSVGLSDITPDIFAQLATAQQKAIRERAEAVGWLARTVADAAPGLRPARYRDALEQARAMGISTDNLPPAYHPGLDPLLRQYGDEAQSFLGRVGDRGAG